MSAHFHTIASGKTSGEDGSFMEVFYSAWAIVQQFIDADAQMPSPANLPKTAQREVAKRLLDRREYPVLEVVEALRAISQPELLEAQQEQASVVLTRGDDVTTGAVIAPEPTIHEGS